MSNAQPKPTGNKPPPPPKPTPPSTVLIKDGAKLDSLARIK